MKLLSIITQIASALTPVNTSDLAIYVYLVPAGAPKLLGVGTIFIKEWCTNF
jgi:hypothetical protein